MDGPQLALHQSAREQKSERSNALKATRKWLRAWRRPWLLHGLWLLAFALLLARTVYAPPYENSPPIRSDGEGYHAWTRALLDWDFRFCQWRGEGFISRVDEARGVCQNKYPPGLAILRLPVMAFLVERDPANPRMFSAGEHRASLILGALALWGSAALIAWSSRLLQLPAVRSIAAIALMTFGTGLFHYGTYDSAFTHIYSAFFCALLIALAARERARLSPVPRSALALSGFFLLALRLTNVGLAAGFALAYLFVTRLPQRAALRRLTYLGAGCALAIGLQLVYNQYAVGSASSSSYGEERFVFDRPMQAAVLLSYERGLLTYTPLYGLALIAGFWQRKARWLALLLLTLTGLYVVLYGYWHSWMLGGGMGHRGFVELAPLLGLVLCVAFGRSSRLLAAPQLIAGAACALVTFQLMTGYWLGTYPTGGATADIYWKHLQLAASVGSGGSFCRRSSCDWLSRENCAGEDVPSLTPCWTADWTPGACSGSGTCAALVALRVVAARRPGHYVSAPPPDQNIKPDRPLVARATQVGPWEKFMLVPASDQSDAVHLRSVASGLYVSVAPSGNQSGVLTASAVTPSEHEKFVPVRLADGAVALRASDARFVTAPVEGNTPQPLRAAAREVDSAERFQLVRAQP